MMNVECFFIYKKIDMLQKKDRNPVQMEWWEILYVIRPKNKY